ncbi:GTP-binding protein [Streptomyces sp. URMC 123]|uniref:GTP-binding protein n=1 Tax=Streptomyces sp. URMC 123 TaxID=3423403 RepID=UPI003F19FF5C
MAKQPYARTRPHLTIGALGQAGHGKTTLTAAIVAVLAARGGAGTGPTEVTRGITIDRGHVEYRTDTRHYAHVDMPDHTDYVRNMVTGSVRLDGAILVVSAPDGVMSQTVAQVLLARQVGVEHVVVALTKADAGDPDLADLVELEARELLSAHGYAGDTLPVVRVSGLRALEGDPRWTGTIEALLDAVDIYVPTPRPRVDAPFLLPVDNVPALGESDTGSLGTGFLATGSLVTGTVERGTVRVGDRVHLTGSDATAVVTGLTIAGTDLAAPAITATVAGGEREEPAAGGPAPGAHAGPGDTVTLRLRGVRPEEVRRGDAVVAPASVTVERRFTARVHLFSTAEGGWGTALRSGRRPRFRLRTAEVAGAVDLGGPAAVAHPGETVPMTVELDRALALEPGLRLTVHDGGRTVGAGTVIAVAGGPGRSPAGTGGGAGGPGPAGAGPTMGP